MSKIGYIRVSSKEQNLDRQIEVMKKHNIQKIFSEKISGNSTLRPELNKMLDFIREGDIVYVESYSRLGRNPRHFYEIIDVFNTKGVALYSDKENIDTQTATGKLILGFIISICAWEREITKERQKEGIAAAKKRGVLGGRPSKFDEKIFNVIYQEYIKNTISALEAARRLKITPITFYKWCKIYKNHVFNKKEV
ncbi:MAG: recombinase family protein [Patescibacteria group bacterium]|jgi:DNA invertase Pin-like site-specific DNA recombinase